MVYTFYPQQKFEMHLGRIMKQVFRWFAVERVVSGAVPALQQALPMPPLKQFWEHYSQSW